MNTNAAAADFAAKIAPYLARTLRMGGMSDTDALEAAVLLWKRDEDEAFGRRICLTHLFGGTYDEFRAEAVA